MDRSVATATPEPARRAVPELTEILRWASLPAGHGHANIVSETAVSGHLENGAVGRPAVADGRGAASGGRGGAVA